MDKENNNQYRTTDFGEASYLNTVLEHKTDASGRILVWTYPDGEAALQHAKKYWRGDATCDPKKLVESMRNNKNTIYKMTKINRYGDI